MRLTRLLLTQFRRHEALTIDFGSEPVFLLGENGAGKTNILESITVLSLGKSALGADDDTLRTFEKDFYRVRGIASSDSGEEKTLEVVSQVLPRVQRACFINDVRTPVSRFVGMLPTVSFLPRDLDLFTGAPADRRRFLDQFLCQVSPPYLESLSKYGQILKQRNALLKRIAQGIAQKSDMEAWDSALSKEGAVLTSLRLELIETFGMSLMAELQTLGEHWVEVHFSYDRASSKTACAELEAELCGLLAQNIDRDVLMQSTSVGPHREDWMLQVNGHPLGEVGSRGQQRVAMLALLFLQASYLELRTGERPVVLLDDICSELDAKHQDRLLNGLSGNQVVLTGVQVPEEFAGEVKVVGAGDRRTVLGEIRTKR